MPRRSAHRLAGLLLSLCLPCGSVAGPSPPVPPHHAEYLLTRDGLPIAAMVTELRIEEGGAYRYKAKTRPQGPLALVGSALEIGPNAHLDEDSLGHIADGRYRPDHYRYRRETNADHRRELTVTFDWSRGRAAMDSEDKPWSMAVPIDTLDKLVVLLSLAQDLAAGARDVTYPVADGGKLKAYRYRVTGQEPITTPAGTWETVRLIRSKGQGTADYRLWIAPALHHLPVLIEREEGGSLFRMELTGFDGRTPAGEDRSGEGAERHQAHD